MAKTRMAKIAVAAIVLLGCFTVGLFALYRVPSHRGDGTFQDLSWPRTGLYPVRGYTISMAEFDLSNPHEAEYRVAELTNVGHDGRVYLQIRGGPVAHDTKQLDGALRLDVLDSQGRTITTATGRLGEFIWSNWMDVDGERYALYQLERGFFTPDNQEEYRIRIAYTPDPKLAGFEGFVEVRSGGTK